MRVDQREQGPRLQADERDRMVEVSGSVTVIMWSMNANYDFLTRQLKQARKGILIKPTNVGRAFVAILAHVVGFLRYSAVWCTCSSVFRVKHAVVST